MMCQKAEFLAQSSSGAIEEENVEHPGKWRDENTSGLNV